MNKHQALVVTLVLALMLNFTLPLALGDYEVGVDLPLFGHVSFYDPSDALTFISGSILTAIIFWIMITERKKS